MSKTKPMGPKTLQDKREQEKKVVNLMIRLYCNGNHGTEKGVLCSRCSQLREYSNARTDHCPHMETKTFCSNCRTHCYRSDMREEIRNVMRWSGPRMMLYHPLTAIRHVIETKKERRLLQGK